MYYSRLLFTRRVPSFSQREDITYDQNVSGESRYEEVRSEEKTLLKKFVSLRASNTKTTLAVGIKGASLTSRLIVKQVLVDSNSIRLLHRKITCNDDHK